MGQNSRITTHIFLGRVTHEDVLRITATEVPGYRTAEIPGMIHVSAILEASLQTQTNRYFAPRCLYTDGYPGDDGGRGNANNGRFARLIYAEVQRLVTDYINCNMGQKLLGVDLLPNREESRLLVRRMVQNVSLS